MNHKQKLMLAVGLFAFGVMKLGGIWWWQKQQIAPEKLPENCQVAISGCHFGQNALLKLENVSHNNAPFRIVATGLPETTQSFSASFSMRDMDMGFNRFDLKRQNDGTWLAENVHLPLCTAARHDWQIEWTLDGKHKFQAAFETQKAAK